MDRDRLRRYWDKESGSYDKQMQFFERLLAPDTRRWVCGQAVGDTLEVAIGTGLNLPHYAPDVRLTGVDFSPAMLSLARGRAQQLGRSMELREGDAEQLPFAAASGVTYDSGDFGGVFTKAVEISDYANFAKRKRESRKNGKQYRSSSLTGDAGVGWAKRRRRVPTVTTTRIRVGTAAPRP